MKCIKKVCANCGSQDVSCDAIVTWNIETQEWEIAGLLDNSDCADCGNECDLEDEELPNV
jgi:hypothetical protein